MIDLTGDKGGRREAVVQVTLPHWSLESLVDTFEIGPADAAEMYVRMGAYPGAFRMADTPSKWGSFIRDAVIEPSIGRDALSLGDVRRPGLLRQLFWAAVSHPAEIVTLQRLQQELPGRPAMETIAHYLSLLEKAWIVAVIKKYSTMSDKKRSSPPKIVALSNALLAAADPKAIPDPARDPARWDAWLRNACIARACNAGQHVSYWRAEPLSADMVVEGSWGRWVVDVRTGPLPPAALRGLAAFTRRFPGFTPLLVGDAAACASAAGAAVRTARWQDYLLGGLPPRQDDAGEARPTPRDDEAPPPRAGRLEPHLL